MTAIDSVRAVNLRTHLFDLSATRAGKEELRQALAALLEHPLATRAFFVRDGSLLVEYPSGYFPTALRIVPIRQGKLLMIRRAAAALDRKMRGMANDIN